jgi:hypothetical protein
MRTSKHFIASIGLIAGIGGLIPGTTAVALASTPKAAPTVLGKSIVNGKGWGSAAPTQIASGIGPGLRITQIHWEHWGTTTATAWGKTSIPRTTGGYYPGLYRIELRATDVAWDSSNHSRAYMRLQARELLHPGGSLGSWFEWVGQQEMCN